MARSKSTSGSQSASNHKLTEFFQRRSTSGSVSNTSTSCASSSPLPASSQTSVSSSPLNHTQSKILPLDPPSARRWNHSNPQTEAARIQKMNSKSVQQARTGALELPPAIRAVKKENAPPPTAIPKERDPEVISLSSTSERAANSVISISSGSPAQNSVISISSGSIQSPPLVPIVEAINSAGVPVRPLRRSQRQASVIDLSSTSPSPKATSAIKNMKLERKPSPAKRKRESVDVFGDLEDVDEVIVISPKRNTLASEVNSDPVVMEECIVISRSSQGQNSPSHIQPNASPKKTPSSRKRSKVGAGDDAAPASSQVIPSSQSDEQELSLPKTTTRKDINEVKENVIAWQKASQQSVGTPASPQWGYVAANEASAPDDDFGTAMDVDTPALSPRPMTPIGHPSLESVALTTHSAPPPHDATFNSHTPPPIQPELLMASSSASSLTKVDSLQPSSSSSKDQLMTLKSPAPPLTSKDKTAMLIADIKKRALLAVSSADVEEKKYEDPLPELPESSDEEEDSVFCGKKRSSSSTLGDGSSSPLTDIDELSPVRKSTRNKKSLATKSDRKLRTPRKSDHALTRTLPKTVAVQATSLSSKKKKVDDPFAALMRAKNACEKRKPIGLGLKSDLDLSLSPNPNGAGGSQIDNPPLSPLLTPLPVSGSQGKSMELGKIFGEDEEAIKRIVSDDREEQAQMKRKGKQKQKVEPVLGVKFWEEGSAANADNNSFVIPKVPQIDTRHSSYQILCTFAASNDIDGVALFLDCGAFIEKGFPITSDFVLWLMKIALSSNEHLAEKATSAILHLIDQGSLDARRCKTRIPLRVFVESLIQSGIKAEILSRLDLLQYRVPCISPHNRSTRVYRWVVLVGALASVNMFEDRQVANLIALLLGVVMDPSSNAELQDTVKKAIETLCNVYCFERKRNETELSICRQSLLLWGSLDISNKTFLMSCVPGGSVVASRIAQWIAFGLLAGDTASDLAAESDEDLLPPLAEVHALLTQQQNDIVSEEAARKFDLRRIGEDDEAEYDALSGNIELLSRVLSNIHQYVRLEQKQRVEAASAASDVKDVFSSPSRTTVSVPKTPFDKIEVALKNMAGRIKDSSSKPERTRAKATIQRLVLRLSYQRNMGSNPSREVMRPKAPKKIDAWFKKSD